MDVLMSKIFGDSWRSTVISILTGLAAFLSFYPDALAPLPDYWENLVRNFLIFLMSAGIISKGFVTRDTAAHKKDASILENKVNNTTERLEGEIQANTDAIIEGDKTKKIQVEVLKAQPVEMTTKEAVLENKKLDQLADKIVESEIVKRLE